VAVNNSQDEERYMEAKKRINDIKGFYTHLAIYIIVNIGIFLTNIVQSPDGLWFYWVTIPWGIGVVIHALTVFVFEGRFLGKEWENKKIKEYMEKNQESQKP
jgi:hypothetical protein